MKVFSVVFISVFCLGIANATVIGILRDLSPIITDLGDTITNVFRNTGSLIGHTFASIDSIIETAEDQLVEANKEVLNILLGTPHDAHHQQCATRLRSTAQTVNTTIIRVCVDTVQVRNTLSERLVEISKLKSQCMSVFTRCLKTPPVDQCIQSEVNAVRSSIEQNEVILQRDAESIKTEVTKCVETKTQQACGTLQTAISDYRRCCGNY